MGKKKPKTQKNLPKPNERQSQSMAMEYKDKVHPDPEGKQLIKKWNYALGVVISFHNAAGLYSERDGR